MNEAFEKQGKVSGTYAHPYGVESYALLQLYSAADHLDRQRMLDGVYELAPDRRITPDGQAHHPHDSPHGWKSTYVDESGSGTCQSCPTGLGG